MNTAQNGKDSKNRLRGSEFKKFDECPLWDNLKKNIKKTLKKESKK